MALVVGEAEVLITANTAGLDAELAAASDSSLGKFGEDAEADGALAGADLRKGVKSETDKIGSDLADAGEGAGAALSGGLSTGAKDIGDDVVEHVDKNTGLMSGLFSDFSSKASSSLESIGVPAALLSAPAAIAVVGVAAGAVFIDMAEKMQNADASIATSEGISIKAATNIGNAFLTTGGQTEFSGQEIAEAFSGVAGQLKAAEGQALTTAQSMAFMKTSTDLATASGTDLSTATSTLATTMQAFGVSVKDAGSASNALFVASNATGQGVDTVGAALDKVKAKLGAVAPPLNQMSALLVDMTDHGETGRAAMTTLSGAFTTFLKPAAALATAQSNLKIAFDGLPDSVKGIADAYQKGTITSSQFTSATEGLSTTQAAAVANFKSAADAAVTADKAQKALGITVVNSKGQMLPLTQIIGQLSDQIKGMTTSQAIAKLTADGFGTSAAKLVTTIQAGSQAFNQATAAVNNNNTVTDAANLKSQTLSVEFKTLESSLVDMGTKIGSALLPLLQVLITTLSSLFNIVSTVLTPAINFLIPIFDNVVGAVTPLLKALTDLIDFVVDVFTGKWQQAWQNIEGFFTNFDQFAEKILQDVVTLFINLPVKIVNALAGLVGDLAGVFEKFPSWVQNTFIPDVLSFIGQLPDDIGQLLSTVEAKLATPFISALDDIIKAYNDIPLLPNIPLIGLPGSSSSTPAASEKESEAGDIHGIAQSSSASSAAAVSAASKAAAGFTTPTTISAGGGGGSSSSGSSGTSSTAKSSVPAIPTLTAAQIAAANKGTGGLDATQAEAGILQGTIPAVTVTPVTTSSTSTSADVSDTSSTMPSTVDRLTVTTMTVQSLSMPPVGPPNVTTLNIAPGAIIINPAPGNDAASLIATEAAVNAMLQQLVQELSAGSSPLSTVG